MLQLLMVLLTTWVCMALSVDFMFVLGARLFVELLRVSENLVERVCFIWRGGGEEEIVLWQGWLFCLHLARNWVQSSSEWGLTGSMLVSWCRWSIGVILIQPVAVRRAEFCAICILL